MTRDKRDALYTDVQKQAHAFVKSLPVPAQEKLWWLLTTAARARSPLFEKRPFGDLHLETETGDFLTDAAFGDVPEETET